ncbi:MAG TPA: vWA domain-containing protein [Intrasporangium sp.]|uniref:vWA domain-containing protein n=1 Tax=Intrasporangium sp. TaxID=1925024 RepID=UPI002B48FE94|nr:vWA domain-containing protein [Intrasporangium sp.]HKX66092.1 vWA domain-containing protein [Intrasporangium sp.]
MTNPNLTHIAFLLDRSGSMHSIKDDTEGGFDAFIAEQRQQGGDCRVTLAQFDNEYEEVYRDLPLAQVPALRLVPRGSTALLDSIGRLVTSTGERLAGLPEDERPGIVIVGIMTDGHENASREWTHPAVKALIEQQTKTYGWQFLYLGADQDAIEVGSSIGVAAANSMTYSRGKVAAVMAATSRNIGRTRAAMAAGATAEQAARLIAFDDDQRAASRE